MSWSTHACNFFAATDVVNRVEHLRRLMLIHSCIYYEMDANVVSDHKWQEWADELATLQLLHGHKFGFYDTAFDGWDGSTGHHLPLRDAAVVMVAQRLLANPCLTKTVNLFA